MEADIINQASQKILEWGALVTVLSIFCVTAGWMINILIKRNDKLADQMIEVIKENSKLLASLGEKIDEISRNY